MKLFPKSFILLLIVGLFLRLFISIWSNNFRENTDVLRYKDWAKIAYIFGLKDTYSSNHISFGTLANNQSPGSLYIISSMFNADILAAKLYFRLTKNTPSTISAFNGPIINFFLRIPSILADLAITILIYKIVTTFKASKKGILSANLFLFNPVVIYNSSFWGQMDSLNNLFFLLAIYCLCKKRYFFSIISMFLSLYIKLSLLFILPIFFLLLLYLYSKKNIIVGSIISVLILCILTLPISSSPFIWIVEFVKKSAEGEMQNITAFAFNFWWIIFKPHVIIGDTASLFSFSEIELIKSPLSTNTYLSIPLYLWGFILFTLSSIPHLFYMLKNKCKNSKHIFIFFSIVIFLGFLFLPKMHERYLYPIFPLLAVVAGYNKKMVWIYIILTILNFINVYIVWHPFILSLLPYTLIRNQSFQWLIAALICTSGIYLYFTSHEILKRHDKS